MTATGANYGERLRTIKGYWKAPLYTGRTAANVYEQSFGGFLNRVSEVRVLPGAPRIRIQIDRIPLCETASPRGLTGSLTDIFAHLATRRMELGKRANGRGAVYLRGDGRWEGQLRLPARSVVCCGLQKTVVFGPFSLAASSRRRLPRSDKPLPSIAPCHL